MTAKYLDANEAACRGLLPAHPEDGALPYFAANRSGIAPAPDASTRDVKPPPVEWAPVELEPNEAAAVSPDDADDDDDTTPGQLKGPNAWQLDERRGVYPLTLSEEGVPTRGAKVCGPLRVLAMVRDLDGIGWEYLLEVRTHDRDWVRIRMPHSLLYGEAKPIVDLFAHAGLWMPSAEAVGKIRIYLRDTATTRRARSVPSAGWQADGRVYIAADRRQWPKPGLRDELYLLDNDRLGAHGLSQHGTLEAWRAEVAARCVGNSRLVFAVSVAFAGSVLRDATAPGGGFHLVGSSSEGKTTALEAAASVWGFPSAEGGSGRPFVQSWNGTSNALGAVAARHSDGLLVVDEIGQADPRTVGNTVYLLANGRERERMTQAGKLGGGGATWRVLFLSSGEKDLDLAIEEGGKTAKAGQDARLPSIPANAGRGHGLFENLHDAADGKAMATALARAVRANHGTAIGAWLDHLAAISPAERSRLMRERIEAFEDEASADLGDAAAGEVHRVVARFAVVAAAGELATGAGLTGWPEGEAKAAAWACFRAWLERRGGSGSKDKGRLLEHVRGVFERHLSTRFELRDGGGVPGGTAQVGARDRLGFVDSTRTRAYVQPVTFKGDFAKGFAESPATASRWLLEAGWLAAGGDAEHPGQRLERIPALGSDPKAPGSGRRAWVHVFELATILGPQQFETTGDTGDRQEREEDDDV